jgi:alanine racemase
LNNWIEVAADKLAANYRAIQSTAGESTEILAVVKANGYGHGADLCSVALVRAGARWLGVTCASEGVRVRRALTQAGLAAEILVMCGFTADETPLLVEHHMQPVVWTLEQIAWLRGTALPVHVEVDTGMNRQGARRGAELAELLASVNQAGLPLEGLLTHFSSSEEAASPRTAMQRQSFAAAVAQVAASGMRPAWVHAGASSAVDNPAPPAAWLCHLAASAGARPMMRTGIALYGYCMTVTGAAPHLRPLLQRVMTWKTRILSLRTLAAGDTVGYNATYTAPNPMRIALLPVGFADGLRRELSSTNDRPGGWVMLHGRRAPILGRISMNLTVIDVTAIPETQPGDEAILLGPGITADDHARLAHTTAYEILCGVHPCG